MDSSQKQPFDIMRVIIIGLLLYVGNALTSYAPMVPKAVTFMDDVHALRQKSADWEQTAASIQKSLSVIEKLASYFEREARREGKTWPK